MEQFQITSKPRHVRYIFFIDEKYSYANLFELICANQQIWGGRYNPIIPVQNNVIASKYIDLLKYYEPDYIFYSYGVDPEILKRLRIFNPCGYFNLDDRPKSNLISGINSLYFLSRHDKNKPIVFAPIYSRIESNLTDYYKVNFGLYNQTNMADYQIAKEAGQTIINTSNFDTLNKTIHIQKPINQAHLSRHSSNTPILRNFEFAKYDEVEIVIAKDKSAISDLLYYWNRFLYSSKNIIYLTVDELLILCEDNYFGGVLYDMGYETTISVASLSLSKEEVGDLIESKLKAIKINRKFQYKDISSFPFDIMDAQGHSDQVFWESDTIQILISNKGFLHLPKLSFTNKKCGELSKWAIDIEIKLISAIDGYNTIKYPLTTDTKEIIKKVEGRINKKRFISIIIDNHLRDAEQLEIEIAEFSNLLHQLVRNPVIHGDSKDTKYKFIRLHDSSNKLFAFIKSFENNFAVINDYFTDIFWVTLFEELIISEKSVGDTIKFEVLKSKAVEALIQKGIILGDIDKPYANEANLELGLKKTLEELCYYRVFFMGFNLKCDHCSSEFWYSISEVKSLINCKGCLEDFALPIEAKFAYKLNDLIKNNIFQTKKDRNGNLTVIRTLSFLHNRSLYSFKYSPQINLYEEHRSKKPAGEIDIVALSDGKFIIGECKHSSQLFFQDNNKSLLSLEEVARNIHPDKIILSCYEDSNDKLANAKKSLEHLFNKWVYEPEIETILLSAPDDYHIGEYRYFYD